MNKYKKINERVSYMRKTKEITIDIGGDEIVIYKTWREDNNDNSYEVDWEFADSESAKIYDKSLDEIEKEDFEEFIDSLN